MNSELSSPGIEPVVIPPAGEDSILVSEEKSVSSKAAAHFPFKIPPILFEGDDPPESQAQGPKSKAAKSASNDFGLGTLDVGLSDLPHSYGTQKLLLTARDPHWLYAHWDLTEEQQHEHAAHAKDGQLKLRVHRENGAEHPIAEVNVHPDARH